MFSRQFVKEYIKRLPIALITVLVFLTGALYIFGVIIHEVFLEKEEEFDSNILHFVSAHVVSPDLTSFMEIVTHLASAHLLQVGYVILITIYLLRKKWKTSIEISCIGIGGFTMNYLLKLLFGRSRPTDPLINGVDNFGFPSGHATSSFIFYGLLAYLVWKLNIPRLYKYVLGLVLICLSILIGFSRVYLRVHYPTDVIAGFCTGFAWLLLCILVFEYLTKKTKSIRS